MVVAVDFRVEAVLRRNNSAAAPTFTRLGRMGTDRIDLTEELNAAGELRFTTRVEALEPEILDCLRDLASSPLEVWLYLDGATDPMFAGAVTSLSPSRDGLAVTCKGLLHYLAAMAVDADVTYTAVDLFTIVKGLVDAWQAQTYGNFGIVTSAIATLGVTGTHTYLVEEQHRVLRRIDDLAEGRFDYKVNSTSRALSLAAAHGLDLTGAVTIDSRNITDPGATVSADWDDVSPVVYGQGTGAAPTVYASKSTSAGLLATFGRVASFASWSDVESAAENNNRTAAVAAYRGDVVFAPSLNLVPVVDVSVGDFTVGDTVTHRYDYGFGVVEGPFRVGTRRISVNRSTGATTISVGFV